MCCCGSHAWETAATAPTALVVAAAALGVAGTLSVREVLMSVGCESEAIQVGDAGVDKGAMVRGAEGAEGKVVATDDENSH